MYIGCYHHIAKLVEHPLYLFLFLHAAIKNEILNSFLQCYFVFKNDSFKGKDILSRHPLSIESVISKQMLHENAFMFVNKHSGL